MQNPHFVFYFACSNCCSCSNCIGNCHIRIHCTSGENAKAFALVVFPCCFSMYKNSWIVRVAVVSAKIVVNVHHNMTAQMRYDFESTSPLANPLHHFRNLDRRAKNVFLSYRPAQFGGARTYNSGIIPNANRKNELANTISQISIPTMRN